MKPFIVKTKQEPKSINPHFYPAKKDLILTADEIIGAVSFITKIPIADIIQKDRTPGARKRKNVLARQLSAFLIRNYCNTTFDSSGSFIVRDHATVIYSCKTVNNLLETDRNFRDLFANLLSYVFMLDRTKKNATLYSMKMIHNENVYIISNHPIFI